MRSRSTTQACAPALLDVERREVVGVSVRVRHDARPWQVIEALGVPELVHDDGLEAREGLLEELGREPDPGLAVSPPILRQEPRRRLVHVDPTFSARADGEALPTGHLVPSVGGARDRVVVLSVDPVVVHDERPVARVVVVRAAAEACDGRDEKRDRATQPPRNCAERRRTISSVDDGVDA